MFIIMMRSSVKKMTSQIIDFLEKVETILTSDRKKKVKLTYSASCEELNDLQLAFFKSIKVI